MTHQQVMTPGRPGQPRGSAGPPVHWPTLGPEEAAYEWNDLRQWVEQYRQRYPIVRPIPDCWWRHNSFVELLAALRDHERASYGRAAPGTAAMEWQHARYVAEVQLDSWAKRITCHAQGRGHPTLSGPAGLSEWDVHVQADVERRRAGT